VLVLFGAFARASGTRRLCTMPSARWDVARVGAEVDCAVAKDAVNKSDTDEHASASA